MDTNLKNIILAGIGSMAYTYEKAENMVDVLVKKGELTVNQGKELNEELKKVLDENKEKQQSTTVNPQIKQIAKDIKDIKTRLDNLEQNK